MYLVVYCNTICIILAYTYLYTYLTIYLSTSIDDLDLEAGGDRLNNNLFSTKSSDGFLQLQRIDEISALWNSVKGYITRGAWEKSTAPTDPISELFAPSSQLDPLRAFRVGGGLLSVHTTPKSPPTSTHNNNNSSTINSPASPISPPHTTTTSAAGSGSVNKSIPIAQFLGWNSAGTQIWARLKMAGLDVKCVLSWDLERVILKIRCPNWRLEQMAEQMHIKLKTRDGYLKQFKVRYMLCLLDIYIVFIELQLLYTYIHIMYYGYCQLLLQLLLL